MAARHPCEGREEQGCGAFRAEFDLMYNEGITKVGDILDIGTNLGGGHRERGAFFYRYNEHRATRSGPRDSQTVLEDQSHHRGRD